MCASPRCFFTLSTASLTEIGDVKYPILPIPYPDLGIYKHTGKILHASWKLNIFVHRMIFMDVQNCLYRLICVYFKNKLRISIISSKLTWNAWKFYCNIKQKVNCHMSTFKNMIILRNSKTSLLHIQ